MKKTLALVLVLTMVLGLMAVPVRADFTDSSDIEYTEAVEVLSAIGVLNGFEDGSFDPSGTLTREQAAKVIAYMMLGQKNADALVATSAPFADVAATRWSAGYISYCANEGIINGRDEKTFDPAGTVTGYEFAKLLLGCLGYSSKIEQYVGASWAINVAKTALDIDLFDGNDGSNYNAPLTREEAALYAFNTLQATLVDYESQGTNIDLGNGVVISTGASKAEDVKDAGNNKDTIKTDALLQFAEKYFDDLELDVDTDDFGRPADIWTYDNDDVGTYATEADYTYTVGTKGKEIYADLGKPSTKTTEYNFFVDGVPYTADDIENGVIVSDADKDAHDDDSAKGLSYADFVIASGNDKKLGGNGVLIEIFEVDPVDEDNTEAYDVVVINTYVATVSDWNEADEDDDEDESIDIAELTAPNGSLDSTFETVAFTEDDVDDDTVVYYTAAWDDDESEYAIQSVVAADSVSATPTTYTTGEKFTADGTTYKYSKQYSGDVSKTMVDDEEDIDIYLDSYGYAIYIDADSTSSDDYAYVAGIEKSSASFSDNYIAKLVLDSGETVVVDLDEDCTDAIDTDNNGTLNDSELTNYNKKIVTYSSNKDDEYTIETTTLKSGVDQLGVTAGSAKITVASGVTVTANSKTVFFVQDDDDYDVYVGIKNVPSITSKSGANVIVAMDGNVAAAVFVSSAKVSNTNKEDFVIVAYDASVKAQYDSTYGNYYEYNVINGSTVETMMFDADLVGTGKDLAPDGDTLKDKLYVLNSISIDDDGIVTDVDVALAADDVYYGVGTVKAEDDLIGLYNDAANNGAGAMEYYTYDDDCNVYKVDSDCKITVSSVGSIRTDANDKVAFILDDDGVVTDIFFISVK